MRLFFQVFIKQNIYLIILLAISVVLGNCAYAIIMAFFSDNSENYGKLVYFIQVHLTLNNLLIFVFVYGVSFVFSFFLQVYLANKFSVDLNLDMDEKINVSSFKENSEISQALVIKDISSEFARFGNNIILPMTEIFKSLIALFIILVAIIITEPILLLPCLILVFLYSGFWIATRKYFVFISKRISHLLFERQKYAEFKYQDFNELNSFSNLSLVQLNFENVLKGIARLNVNSKTVAITPRAVIETAVLAGLVYSASWFDKGSFILLGLAGLKLVVSAQAISVGVSNLQLNWPAFVEYAERRNFYDKSQEDQAKFKKQSFPTLVHPGVYSAPKLGIDFIVSSEINLKNVNICLLRGPSGIGKSTFLNCLCGFHSIIQDVSTTVKLGNKGVAFLGQNTQIITGTIKDNFDYITNGNWSHDLAITLYEHFFGFSSDEPGGKELEFKNFLNTSVGVNAGISGGEAKRIRIMSSLLSDAEIFIWDEPFDGIHPEKIYSIIKFLKNIKEKTFLIIDHNVLSQADAGATIRFSKKEDRSRSVLCDFYKEGLETNEV